MTFDFSKRFQDNLEKLSEESLFSTFPRTQTSSLPTAGLVKRSPKSVVFPQKSVHRTGKHSGHPYGKSSRWAIAFLANSKHRRPNRSFSTSCTQQDAGRVDPTCRVQVSHLIPEILTRNQKSRTAARSSTRFNHGSTRRRVFPLGNPPDSGQGNEPGRLGGGIWTKASYSFTPVGRRESEGGGPLAAQPQW